MSIQVFNYEGYQIQFDEINGVLMANATLMADAFNKRPGDIFKTITWQEFETALCVDSNLRLEDIRSVKNGEKGGSWIHQELVVEFARRLNPKFALWCNRKIAELMRTGKTEIAKPLSAAEALLQNVQLLVAQEQRLNAVEEKVKQIEAKAITSPTDYFTIAGYSSLRGIKIDAPGAARLGKKASSICNANGYLMGKVSDPRFGTVKTYPVEALDLAFSDTVK